MNKIKELLNGKTYGRIHMTPMLAEQVVTPNRTTKTGIRPTTLAKYVRMMQNEQWIEATDTGPTNPILFSAETGECLDGNHRLCAIVTSQKPQYVWASIVSSACMPSIDQPTIRTPADLSGGEFSKDEMAIARSILTMSIANKTNATYIKTYKVNNIDVLDFANTYKDGIHFGGNLMKGKKIKGLIIAAVFAPMTMAYYSVDTTKILKFVTALKSGFQETSLDKTAVSLRNSITGIREAPQKKFKKSQAALHAYIAGRELTRCFEREGILFPLPVRDKVNATSNWFAEIKNRG